MNEPIAPQPKYPRSWMYPFLVAYAESGNLAATAALFYVTPKNIQFQIAHYPGFAAAFAEAQGHVAERIWNHNKHRVIDVW